MSPLEKLARDLCWSGFSASGRQGKTKASYWLDISEDARAGYMRDAKLVVWAENNIKREVIRAAAI